METPEKGFVKGETHEKGVVVRGETPGKRKHPKRGVEKKKKKKKNTRKGSGGERGNTRKGAEKEETHESEVGRRTHPKGGWGERRRTHPKKGGMGKSKHPKGGAKGNAQKSCEKENTRKG